MLNLPRPRYHNPLAWYYLSAYEWKTWRTVGVIAAQFNVPSMPILAPHKVVHDRHLSVKLLLLVHFLLGCLMFARLFLFFFLFFGFSTNLCRLFDIRVFICFVFVLFGLSTNLCRRQLESQHNSHRPSCCTGKGRRASKSGLKPGMGEVPVTVSCERLVFEFGNRIFCISFFTLHVCVSATSFPGSFISWPPPSFFGGGDQEAKERGNEVGVSATGLWSEWKAALRRASLRFVMLHVRLVNPAEHVATWSNNAACNMLHPFGHGFSRSTELIITLRLSPYHTLHTTHTIPHIPYYTTPYHTYYTTPYRTIPFHIIAHHTLPYHTIAYHTIPQHIMRFINSSRFSQSTHSIRTHLQDLSSLAPSSSRPFPGCGLSPYTPVQVPLQEGHRTILVPVCTLWFWSNY